MHSASYFEAASGFEPLPFQLAWMEQGEAAPIRTLEAPTGLGKTLATLVGWLWDRRQRPESTPRRLVYQLPLRTLTDQIAEECRAVIERQELAIPVHVLRGGQIDNDYVDALAAEAVIVGTLDQVVSRQLMRGYCCSRWSWPRHFAALNTDVRVVVDETQLQGTHVGGRWGAAADRVVGRTYAHPGRACPLAVVALAGWRFGGSPLASAGSASSAEASPARWANRRCDW